MNIQTYDNNITKDDLETEHIISILKNEFNLYESHEEKVRRQVVLSKLKSLIKNFVYSVGIKKGIPEEESKFGGNIYAFGSYRLGVHAPGSDIDVLFVAPNYVDRQKDFFGDFLQKLKSENDISELCDVPGAHVPVIKMKYCGIPIDLVFANIHFKLTQETIDLQNDNILINCDRESILSLNGSRVTDMILKLVPNLDSFLVTLKAIKKWAKCRGLYSNVFGYLGGINYAILVAKICQMNPLMKPNKLLAEFFSVFSTWKFDKEPVTLTEIIKDKGFKVEADLFNPDNPKVSYQMAIVTPAFPAFNSTHNVSETTKKIIIKEFENSSKVMKLIEEGQLPWLALFEKIDFFKLYKGYVQIDIVSTNESDFKKWLGFVESKLKRLIKHFEDVSQIQFHPFPQDFEILVEKFKFSKTFFFGMKFLDPNILYSEDTMNKEQYMKLNLREAVIKFIRELLISDTRNKNTMNLRIRDIEPKELPESLFKEKDKVKDKNNV